MNKRYTILGTCVSRDIFNFDKELELNGYYPRTSLQSIFGEKFDIDVNSIITKSEYHKKLITYDFESRFLSHEFGKNDYLIIDIGDERFKVIKKDGKVIGTASYEYSISNLSQIINDTIIVTNEIDDWKKSFDKFAEYVESIGMKNRIILHEFYCKDKYIDRNGQIQEFTDRLESNKKTNEFFYKLNSYIKEKIPNIWVIGDKSNQFLAYENHMWGLAPFHYEDNYYLNLSKQINMIEDTNISKFNKVKVLSVFGTRPEAIKMCPLIKKMEQDNEIESIVCVTAQHREMLDVVLDIFNVKADYDLNIMNHGQTIVDVSNKVLTGVDSVIKESCPDIVLVHGDTSTTLNSALAAFYNKVPVGHVEAGLRSGDIYSPFPEEANRKLTGSITTLHFAPTKSNEINLRNEGIFKNIFVTGNTVIDALLSVVNNGYRFSNEALNNINFDSEKVILLTTHRRENWGEPMKEIFAAVRELAEKNSNVRIIFPMHKNPMIRKLANESFKGIEEKINLIEPLEYVDFANLMAKCYLIMTDSGGIQEEAPALGKPVIVLRTETERPEAIEAGTVKLVGVDKNRIFEVLNVLLNNELEYENMAKSVNPYGDGYSCDRIISIIKEKLK